MKLNAYYLVVSLIAFAIPLVGLPHSSPPEPSDSLFAGWPHQFAGQSLRRLPLSERETRFLLEFPGKIARFTDGSRELIVRWVTTPTRKLHSASDCFRGLGFSISPAAAHADDRGQLWSSFVASQDDRSFTVNERIFDNAWNSWMHVSGWYWAAILGRTQGPWWAITVANEHRGTTGTMGSTLDPNSIEN